MTSAVRKIQRATGQRRGVQGWIRRVPVALLVVKNLPANAGDIKDVGSIPGWEDPLEGRHGSPLQYSCLENCMDRGAWWATVHRL